MDFLSYPSYWIMSIKLYNNINFQSRELLLTKIERSNLCCRTITREKRRVDIFGSKRRWLIAEWKELILSLRLLDYMALLTTAWWIRVSVRRLRDLKILYRSYIGMKKCVIYICTLSWWNSIVSLFCFRILSNTTKLRWHSIWGT